MKGVVLKTLTNDIDSLMICRPLLSCKVNSRSSFYTEFLSPEDTTGAYFIHIIIDGCIIFSTLSIIFEKKKTCDFLQFS